MELGGYKVHKRVVKPSQPKLAGSLTKPKLTGGFTKQVCRWDVIAPNGAEVRTFRSPQHAYAEIRRRLDRGRLLQDARAEARATGEPVVIKSRGRSPVTVTFLNKT